MLKEGLMCQADTTILTMKWGQHKPVPSANLNSPHECVNWERLQEWVEPHSIDILADGVLVHPDFGELNGQIQVFRV